MHLENLIEACERSLRQPYAVRLAHINIVRVGWTWRVDVEINDGGIVHAEGAVRGKAVRDAHSRLIIWLRDCGV